MKKRRYRGIRPVGASIQIDFMFMGRRRETLALEPTAANQAYAHELRETIRGAISLGKFGLKEYAQYFPKSEWLAQQCSTGPAGTVASALDAWFERANTTLKPSTARSYRNAINELKSDAIGALALRELTTPVLRERVAAWQREHITVKTIKNKLLPLRGMLDDAVERGEIDDNPLYRMRRIKRPDWENAQRLVSQEIDPFDLEEVAIITGAATGQIRNFVQFGFWSGLRTGEIFALAWEDIDWVKKRVRVMRSRTDSALVTPKTGSGARFVDMLPPVIEALEDQKQYTFMRKPVDCGQFGSLRPVFYNPYTNDVWMDDQQFRKGFWIPLLRKTGVRYRYPYQMRHTYASTLISFGEAPEWVAKQMGHIDTTMVRKRYAKWLEQAAHQAGRSGGSKIGKMWERNDGRRVAG